jgi:hypothetical protein
MDDHAPFSQSALTHSLAFLLVFGRGFSHRPFLPVRPYRTTTPTTTYRRIAAILCSAAVGVQATFFTTYDLPMARNKEHVLSGTQRQARALVNRYILGGNGEPPPDAADTSDNPK